jgi:hypothetical protein
MARFNLRGGTKLLLMVVGTLTVIITLMMTFMETPEKKSSLIFGELEIKESRRTTATKKTSNYQSIKDRQKKVEKSNLRYKERKSEENPFFSFYREQKAQPRKQERSPQKVAKVGKNKIEEVGFFNAYNSDLKQENIFFEAVFREPQQVQDGKALRIFLKEAIPALQLEVGTILKGVPYLEGGSRLKIRITAAIVDNKVRKVELLCFDKADCMEGLYHDDLAAQLEEDTKTGLLDEAFDLDLSEGEITRKGGRIARKFSDLTRRNKTIVIERGRELFVAVPENSETY